MSLQLSPRQTQIAELLAEGYSHKEIAEICGIARGTVDVHIRNMVEKTESTNTPNLIAGLVRKKVIK